MSGCASEAASFLNTARGLFADPPPPSLDPQHSYLRALLDGREVFLVLGFVDSPEEGPTEVWYSGAGEVLRLRQGRIVGTTGLSTDWRAVRFSFEPHWPARSGAPASIRFQRERDLMPGYRTGIRDDVERLEIAAPATSMLARHDARTLRWFEERSSTHPPQAALPPARFALAVVDSKPVVVYSEQCLTVDLCLSLERWSPAPAATDS